MAKQKSIKMVDQDVQEGDLIRIVFKTGGEFTGYVAEKEDKSRTSGGRCVYCFYLDSFNHKSNFEKRDFISSMQTGLMALPYVLEGKFCLENSLSQQRKRNYPTNLEIDYYEVLRRYRE